MEVKPLVLIILFVFVRYVSCEKTNTFDLRLEKVEIKDTDSSLNKETELKNIEISPDDKNLSKKRSFFSNSNIGSDYPNNFSEDEFIIKEKNNLKELDKNSFGSHNEELNWERDRIKHPFFGGLDLDSSRNIEKLQSNQFFNHHSKSNYDWERRNSAFEGNRPHPNKGRELNHFGDVLPSDNTHRDGEKHEVFVTNSKLPIKKHPRYHLNGAKDILKSQDFYDSDAPFIINIKTECPSTKLNKNKIMHKFVFVPKSRIRAQSESSFHFPGHSFFDSNLITPPLYYF